MSSDVTVEDLHRDAASSSSSVPTTLAQGSVALQRRLFERGPHPDEAQGVLQARPPVVTPRPLNMSPERSACTAAREASLRCRPIQEAIRIHTPTERSASAGRPGSAQGSASGPRPGSRQRALPKTIVGPSTRAKQDWKTVASARRRRGRSPAVAAVEGRAGQGLVERDTAQSWLHSGAVAP